jgi:hypothetical protein
MTQNVRKIMSHGPVTKSGLNPHYGVKKYFIFADIAILEYKE